ncbi:RacO protein [Streptomyces mobaraensis NBRC 13819 = DSM 40847]|uniref:RacO protein n=1 Tax=Streptomyces mobaraensis (strain ATCC 29032 / DSM 40847 / JCM 4168 / NBRC 13819 / NCIMB 11159 / IPCR 16-22) TaxID=1223523 RepID=M3B580_STRM1|nr:DUF6192 family protein [Streptomyces mobaraensis]EMF01163.1 hypothetical protein H340_07663 [Streptomyces mobaraensis NBRC 13819 = DSM 40847]QTT72292.1 RacO protein [Streptomyces mobaraensis NBRC 13819 = DSM 40847]
MSEDDTKVGSVSQKRYEEIVAELRKVVEQQTTGQFVIGDRALEIEPMRLRGGRHEVAPGQELFTVRESLHRLAEDIGMSYKTVEKQRWTASRWPKERRRSGVSFTVHRILAHIEDERERFEAIGKPPAGKMRWTPDDAHRRVGQQAAKPVSPQEKINAIHTLAREEEVASQVATVMLHRPEIAARAMADNTARHMVNQAQVERGRQAREHFERTDVFAPAVRRIEHSIEFLDLVAACHAFTAAAGRVVPGLRDRRLSEDERAVVHQRVAGVRATLDWIENAVETGKVDMDAELARLLRGE